MAGGRNSYPKVQTGGGPAALLPEKSRVFPLRIKMGFPQELKTVRFNLEPKRCKSVSLSAKRSVSSLVDPLVGLAHGVVTEKLRFPYHEMFFFLPGFVFLPNFLPYALNVRT